MPTSANVASPIRVAVLGATGIGRYHVRELARAGAEVVAVLGSSLDSAARTARELARAYGELGVAPRPLATLDEVLAQELDAVSIATPHEQHLDAAMRALLAGLHVFCEKPLFWRPGLTRDQAKPILAELSMAGARERLCVNTSNASFIAHLRDRGLLPGPPRAFGFGLSTSGRDEGLAIGVDLLPHALSLLHEWAAAREPGREASLTELEVRSYRHAFDARFRFGARDDEPFGTECRLLLEERPDHDKFMGFSLNGLEVERVQRTGADGRYRVSLRASGEELEAEDPFRVYIGGFLENLRTGAPMPVDFDTSARILLDSLQLLEAARASE